MTLATIIQARMGSTRLPGKVLIKIGDHTILQHVINRIHQCPAATGETIVATTARGGDQPIVDLCQTIGIRCYRSSEHDVLNRYYRCAQDANVDQVLRVTADMPLLCPTLTNTILQWAHHDDDYVTVTNTPLGLTPELIRTTALERSWRDATRDDEREHVTLHIINHPDRYQHAIIQSEDWLFDRRHWRLTVDYQEDIDLLERLYLLTDGELFNLPTSDVVAAVEHDNAALELATRKAA